MFELPQPFRFLKPLNSLHQRLANSGYYVMRMLLKIPQLRIESQQSQMSYALLQVDENPCSVGCMKAHSCIYAHISAFVGFVRTLQNPS